jgi:basic amino acid/polyamine antiporter, APA family
MLAGRSGGVTVLRSIGLWGITAIVLNQIIGSGVFALPGTIAARLGWYSLLALVVAAGVTALIILSFGEVASRFTEAGGPYLYAQAAFGRLVGLQMGWMALFVRLVSAAVQVNLLTTYLAEFWPVAGTRLGSAVIAAALLGVLTVVNLRGARPGARLSGGFAVAKVGTLLAFAGLGLLWIARGNATPAPVPSDPTPAGWLGVLLLLMFSYGGFETATFPMGESRNPRRDAPRALLAGLGAVVVVYLLVQVAVLVTLPDPGDTGRPLAEAAGVMLGRGGAVAMTAVAITSVYGWGSAAMLAVPRLTFAMAERGDLPAFFAWVHPRWRTPWVSILTYAILVFVLSLQGGLLQNITLSTVSRLLTYGLVCAALPALRWRERQPNSGVAAAAFRVPFGTAVALIGLLATLVLVTRMSARDGVWLAVVVGLALLHWVAVRRRPGLRGAA